MILINKDVNSILEDVGKGPFLIYVFHGTLQWKFHSVDSYVTKEVWTPTSQNVDVVLTNVNSKPKWKESGEVE